MLHELDRGLLDEVVFGVAGHFYSTFYLQILGATHLIKYLSL